MQSALIILVGVLVIFLIFGDIRSKHSIMISPEKAASINYKRWPVWTDIDTDNNKIRMLWILHDYVPFVNAGSEICAHTINRYLSTKSERFEIYVGSPGFPQRVFENIRCFDLYNTEIFERVLKHSHIINSHSYLYRDQLLWLSRITGKPFVEWVHTINYTRSIDTMKWNDTRLDGRQWTVFNSKSLRNTRTDISERFTKIFFPIVNYRDYEIDDEDRRPVYVTLSNVNTNKGGNVLIQLAKALPEMNFQGILGGYRKQIVNADLPNLKYIRHTTEIKDVYSQTWVLIMPSKEETWGRTAVEAMSSGIPVIASPTPGLKECCGDAAIYCDRDDLEEWVRTLKRLRSDRAFYRHHSKLAYERARALDPIPGLSEIEEWFATDVVKSGRMTENRMPNTFEKNLLFR